MVKSNSACEAHDNGERMDPRQRKRIQNRAAQRTYREKLKKRIEDLEKWRDVALAMTSSKRQDTRESNKGSGRETLDQSSWASLLQMLPFESQASPSPSPPPVGCSPPPSHRPSLSQKSMEPDIEAPLTFGDWNVEPSGPMGMFHDFGLPQLEDIPTRTPPPTDQSILSPMENASTARASEPNGNPADLTTVDYSHAGLLSPGNATSRTASFKGSDIAPQSCQSIDPESDGKTAFHLAVENNQQKMVRILMRLVPDLNCRDAKGRTAMHLAVENNRVSVVEILAGSDAEQIDGGARSFANINVQDVDGLTPLHYAVIRSQVKMVKRLFYISRVDLEIKDYEGRTALPQAVLSGFDEVAEALIEKGADFNATVG